MPTGTAGQRANQIMLAELQLHWSRLLAEVLEHDWYGTAGLIVTIQDGTIQSPFREIRERKLDPR